jgi:starch phosphorylase
MAQFAARSDVRDRVVFLADYDIALMERLACGVDVWINTPRRPWEACGTSGMKLLVNGGVNLSVLDGWWAEAFSPEVGWAIGDGHEHDGAWWDALEAGELYDLLERQIIPEFYARDPDGIARPWLRRIRASLSQLTPRFSSYRMLREYVDNAYAPAAAAYRRRSADNGAVAAALASWRAALDAHWGDIRFGEVHVERRDESWAFQVGVSLGGLDPHAVRVELYADPDGDGAEPALMAPADVAIADGAVHLYRASVPASRPASHYTPRVVPWRQEAGVPLEDARILWYR